MKYAKCHPNRPHKAKGMCESCYRKSLGFATQRKYNATHLDVGRRASLRYGKKNRKLLALKMRLKRYRLVGWEGKEGR